MILSDTCQELPWLSPAQCTCLLRPPAMLPHPMEEDFRAGQMPCLLLWMQQSQGSRTATALGRSARPKSSGTHARCHTSQHASSFTTLKSTRSLAGSRGCAACAGVPCRPGREAGDSSDDEAPAPTAEIGPQEYLPGSLVDLEGTDIVAEDGTIMQPSAAFCR